MGGEEEFYVSYSQQPGQAEAEIEPDVRGWLARFLTVHRNVTWTANSAALICGHAEAELSTQLVKQPAGLRSSVFSIPRYS
jgi:hypothetical protein